VDAVRRLSPRPVDFTADVAPIGLGGLKLTPRHYAYLKISEGCDHRCSFCIIPQMRGDLASRPIGEVLREAEALAASGVKELLVVAQDTSAYGLDVRYAPGEWRGRLWKTNLEDLCRALGELGVWVRLHYVYPYPSVDAVIPLMAEGKVLPYLDIPYQHAAPKVLKGMKRPANTARTLERLAAWRAVCPELVVRSTFVVGFPGETEADFQLLLDWLAEARLDRVGCFKYENVAGAPARDLPDHVPEEVKQARWDRFMAAAGAISREKLAARVGTTTEVLVDEVRRDGVAVARSKADAPEIDGNVLIRPGGRLLVGDLVEVRVERADAYDLWATPMDEALRAPVRTALRPGMRRVIARA
jgi:ribosomal protein S12 methylthiotransferase